MGTCLLSKYLYIHVKEENSPRQIDIRTRVTAIFIMHKVPTGCIAK